MAIAVGVVSLLMILGTSRRDLVPSRLQSVGEIFFEFVTNMIRQTAGDEGLRFFPFVFTLFMFLLMSNLIGLVPYSFAVTSQIVVTASLALTVIAIVLIHGFWRHGFGFLRLFVPHGVPKPVLIVLTPIEIVSFLSRPVSLSVRLFANMLAGHITLQVFGAFVISLAGAGVWAFLTPLPILGAVAMFALELLVACLQAFVFAVLTCVYLSDAIHPGH
jgi:F-type H+-transporting ATPase subunit a